MALVPRQSALHLELNTLDGARFVRAGQTPEHLRRVFYRAAVSTMPCARPHATEILTSLDFAVGNNYPARGAA